MLGPSFRSSRPLPRPMLPRHRLQAMRQTRRSVGSQHLLLALAVNLLAEAPLVRYAAK